MSISTIEVIMKRIAYATPASPIAVFAVPDNQHEMLNAVFGDTSETQRSIANNDPNFIGVFSKNMDLENIRNILITAVKENVLELD